MVRPKSISLPYFACNQWFISYRHEIESRRKFPITYMFLIRILQNYYLNKIYVFSSLHTATHYFHGAEQALVSLLLF